MGRKSVPSFALQSHENKKTPTSLQRPFICWHSFWFLFSLIFSRQTSLVFLIFPSWSVPGGFFTTLSTIFYQGIKEVHFPKSYLGPYTQDHTLCSWCGHTSPEWARVGSGTSVQAEISLGVPLGRQGKVHQGSCWAPCPLLLFVFFSWCSVRCGHKRGPEGGVQTTKFIILRSMP